MANIKSAKKRIKVIEKKTAKNRRIKAHIKAILKSFDAALSEGDLESAKEQLAMAEKKLMQAAAKGTVHKNNASRKVARLTKDSTKHKKKHKTHPSPPAHKLNAQKKDNKKDGSVSRLFLLFDLLCKFYFTLTLNLAVRPLFFVFTVIVALPFFFAFTVPFDVTVATFLLDDLNVTDLGLVFEGFQRMTILYFLPLLIVFDFFFSFIDLGYTGLTRPFTLYSSFAFAPLL